MKTPFAPTFFAFEQVRRDEKASKIREMEAAKAAQTRELEAARAKVTAARIARKKIEADAKCSRRNKRQMIARDNAKLQERSAQCGTNFYAGGCGWSKCHTCGQPLVYRSFNESQQNPQRCEPPPRTISPSTTSGPPPASSITAAASPMGRPSPPPCSVSPANIATSPSSSPNP